MKIVFHPNENMFLPFVAALLRGSPFLHLKQVSLVSRVKVVECRLRNVTA